MRYYRIQLLLGAILVTDNQENTEYPRLWISYQWIHSEERDFEYLTRQLSDEKFNAVYDSFKIMPDARLSQRIVQRLQSVGFDGWLYVLTHQCIARRDYTNELTAAIDQTKLHMGPHFPMAGLMYGIATTHLPAMLRVLPCISLGDPNWNSLVREIFNKYVSAGSRSPEHKESRYIWKIHRHYGGDPSLTAIEVRSRGEFIQNWRFAVPISCHLTRWGQGPAGGGDISRVRFSAVTGTGKYEKNEVFWFGASNTVSNAESAYALFVGKLPDFICFGPSKSPNGIPGQMDIFWPLRHTN